MLVGVLLLVMMRPSVVVEGEATCPSPADVARRLGELMASIPDGVAQDRARLGRKGATDALEIDLFRDDGARIAERALPANGSCEDLASATAVVIATWEAQLRPQRLARVALSAPPTVAVAPAPPPPAPPLEGGVGALAFVAEGRAVPGVVLVGAWGERLGIHAALSVGFLRVDSVLETGGSIHWTRTTLAVGPRYRLARRWVRAEGYVAALGGLLFVGGTGFEANGYDLSPRVGGEVGVRIGPAWDRKVVPWLGVGVQAWPQREHVLIEGVGGELVIPQVELQVALGVSFGRF